MYLCLKLSSNLSCVLIVAGASDLRTPGNHQARAFEADCTGTEAPAESIQRPHTELGDPHVL